MAISITNFKGSNPRLEPHLLSGEQGYIALDCRLENGGISAWYEREVFTYVGDTSININWFNCSIIATDKMIDIAQTRVNSNRVAVTGIREYPVMATVEDSGTFTNIYRLGVPQPTTPLVIKSVSSLDSLPIRSREARAYAYAYINNWGELGALSPPVFLPEAADGCSVSLDGWELPSTEWGVTTVNIYRAISGAGSSMPIIDVENPFDTAWMLVGSVNVYAGNVFLDDVYNEHLSRSFVDLYCAPPPSSLQGVVSIPGTNRMAGYSGNRVYLSHNDSYHNWQEYFDLDDMVCGIAAAIGAVYVVTSGRPYTISIDVNAPDKTGPVIQHQEALPALSCGNNKIAVLPDNTAIYASARGLVALRGGGLPSVITDSLFYEDMWLRKIPSTMVIRFINGFLFCFGSHYSFCISLGNNGWDNDTFVELSDHDIIDAKVTNGGVLSLLSTDGNVYLWDRSTVKRPYTWRSKTFIADTPVMMGAYKTRVGNGSVDMVINVDGFDVISESIYNDTKGLLPMYSYGSDWWVMFKGIGTVKTISIGPTLQELS